MLSLTIRRAAPRLVRTYATPVEFKQPKIDPQLGDYPQLPPISAQRRPAKGWWNNQERRNFGETVSLPPDYLTHTKPTNGWLDFNV